MPGDSCLAIPKVNNLKNHCKNSIVDLQQKFRIIHLVQTGNEWLPKGYETVIPYLTVRNAASAIELYRTLFGAIERSRMAYPDKPLLMHAEITIQGHTIMLSDENEAYGMLSPLSLNGPSPVSVMVYVPDVDAVFKTAEANGCKILMPPMDAFWGDRFGKFADHYGHLWSVATHLHDVAPDQMAKAAAEEFAKQPNS